MNGEISRAALPDRKAIFIKALFRFMALLLRWGALQAFRFLYAFAYSMIIITL
ncbi:hypothetical protein [Nostoc sp.]|uniref:hypothetical protein n=1 Tax=Nostoc sp. TaxID=1180 RepID=UPI002FEF615A